MQYGYRCLRISHTDAKATLPQGVSHQDPPDSHHPQLKKVRLWKDVFNYLSIFHNQYKMLIGATHQVDVFQRVAIHKD